MEVNIDEGYLIHHNKDCSYKTFQTFFAGQTTDTAIPEIIRQAYATSRSNLSVRSEVLEKLIATKPQNVNTSTVRQCLYAWIVTLDDIYLKTLAAWGKSTSTRALYRHDILVTINYLKETYPIMTQGIDAPNPAANSLFGTIASLISNMFD